MENNEQPIDFVSPAETMHKHEEVVKSPKNLIMVDVAAELGGIRIENLGQVPENEKQPSELGESMFRVAINSLEVDTSAFYQATEEKQGSLPGKFVTNVTAGEGVLEFRKYTSIPADELIFDQPLGVGANVRGAQGLVGVYRKKV